MVWGIDSVSEGGDFMKKFIIGLITVLILTGCAGEPETIRIGVNDWPPCEVWYVAQEQGLFEDVQVEIVRFSTWTDNMNALYLGNIDITHSTYFNNILYSDKGEWGQMIAPIDTIHGSDGMVVKNDIEDLSDLAGKKIAVEVGTDEHYLLFKALEHFGIAINDVTIVSASSAKTADLFIRGEVDAIFTYEPYMSMAATEGDGKVVFTTEDLQGHMVDVLVGDQSRMAEHPDAFVNVMKGYYAARDYIETGEGFGLMARNEGMTEEAFQGFYESFILYSPEQALQIMASKDYESIHEEMTKFIYDNGLAGSVKEQDALLNKDIINGVVMDEK